MQDWYISNSNNFKQIKSFLILKKKFILSIIENILLLFDIPSVETIEIVERTGLHKYFPAAKRIWWGVTLHQH